MQAPVAENTIVRSRRIKPWQAALLAAALVYAAPIGWDAYHKVRAVNQQARERLILQHRLWELQPGFQGKPEIWARIASRLLSDWQLMRRVHAKYGAAADEIELEYRRDLAIARAEVVFIALSIWALPVGLMYSAAWALVRRRKRGPPPKVQPPSVSDPRYLPPER